jgi:hypothetical protein
MDKLKKDLAEAEKQIRIQIQVRGRAARFFWIQYTKMEKMYQIATKLPNGHKLYQLAAINSRWP